MNEQPVSTSLRAKIVVAICVRGVSLALMLLVFVGVLHLQDTLEHGRMALFAVALQTAAVVASLARQRLSWTLWLAGIGLLAVGRFEVLVSMLPTVLSLPGVTGWWPRSASGEVVAAYRSMLTKLFVGTTLLVWLPLLVLALHAFHGAASPLAAMLALACVVLTLLATILTLRKHADAYTLWLRVTAASFVTFGVAIAVNELYVASNMVVMVGWVGGILAAAGALDLEGSRRPTGIVAGVVVALTLIGTTMLLLADDLRAFRDDVRRARWAERCNGGAGDVDACGWWAQYTVERSDAADDLDEARRRFEELCERGVWGGCTFATQMLKDRKFVFYEPPSRWLAQRRDSAVAACDQGVPAACAVEFVAIEEIPYDETRMRGACDAGDAAACSLYLERPHPELCDLGFAPFCEGAPCGRGNLQACDYDYPREPWNALLYGVRVDAAGLDEACEGGDGEACFALGLNATADVNPFVEPVPTRSLDATWGRACTLGFDMACTFYALRLLDRPLEAPRDEARAAQLLDTACARGDANACWVAEIALGKLPARADLAGLTATAWASCEQSTEGCFSYVLLRAVELEIDPYPVLQPYAVRVAEKACALGRAHFCSLAVHAHYQGVDMLPLVVRGFDTAARGCRMADAWSCKMLFRFAETMQSGGAPDPEGLRAKICPQVPDACD